MATSTVLELEQDGTESSQSVESGIWWASTSIFGEFLESSNSELDRLWSLLEWSSNKWRSVGETVCWLIGYWGDLSAVEVEAG